MNLFPRFFCFFRRLDVGANGEHRVIARLGDALATEAELVGVCAVPIGAGQRIAELALARARDDDAAQAVDDDDVTGGDGFADVAHPHHCR
jgi:hypothetical protein